MDGDTDFIDSRAARLIALALLVACVALLAWLHRDDLFPPDEAVPDNPALAACIQERSGHVDRMLEDGVVTPAQASDFRERAIQFCEQQNPPEQ